MHPFWVRPPTITTMYRWGLFYSLLIGDTHRPVLEPVVPKGTYTMHSKESRLGGIKVHLKVLHYVIPLGILVEYIFIKVLIE